jgi:hypothetical protein
MLQDALDLFADELAYNGSPTEIDLGSPRPGPGEPLKIFFMAHEALTGCTGLQVLTADESPADENLMSIDNLPPVGEVASFMLPSTTKRFVTIDLLGTVTAGSFSSGVCFLAQSNR